MFLEGVAPFVLAPDEKAAFLLPRLIELVEHHRQHCERYRWLLDAGVRRHHTTSRIEDVSFVPVTAFKEFDLRSTEGDVLSVSSSATSGTASRIAVDRETRKRQNVSAAKLLSDFVGADRRPCVVFDLEATTRGTQSMSAGGAAILAVAQLASEVHFVMREDADGQLVVDHEALRRALTAIGDRPFVGYGFTYVLYQAHQALVAGRVSLASHPSTVLLHSGGWKRLQDLEIEKAAFGALIAGVWGLPPTQVIDFYGMVEQVGVLYPDCSHGVKHVPYWADVIIRRRDSLDAAAPGETGLIQLLNCLPLAAPNHSVLTEDLGELVCLDGCPCGRRGKAFVFKGRVPVAEVRGCSDVARV